jgi:protein dopey
MGFLLEPVNSSSGRKARKGQDVLSSLQIVIPKLKVVLVENDRVQNVINSITANVTGPTLRAKAFPSNIDKRFSGVLLELTKISLATKLWKKDVSDALNDSRFFSMPFNLIQEHWLPIIHEYVRNDNDRLPEFLSRITAPATAGIVFGVGATSARLEADRKTQLNLRRITLLLLSSPLDTFAQNVPIIQEKLLELITATSTSSPSAVTRADVFLLMRALFLKISTLHLGSIWPIVNSELQSALLSVLPESEDFEKYSNISVIQACKLLDLLVTLDLDEFQLHEWLFITDTIDAVYRPPNTTSHALVDTLSDSLSRLTIESEASDISAPSATPLSASTGAKLRKPILDVLLESTNVDIADLRAMPKQDLAVRLLKPFFGQLSLLAFEATYGMLQPDHEFCLDGLLEDIFEDGGELV